MASISHRPKLAILYSRYWVVLLTFSLTCLLPASVGCKSVTRRGQSPDDDPVVDKRSDGSKYIGDACRPYGVNYAKVEGIGLAVGLHGTGSNPTNSGQREHLKKSLMASGASDASDMISSDNTSMVILTGYLPPGIRKGDRFDVHARVMRNSETTSLEDGFLLKTELRPMANLGRGMKQGNITGYTEGHIFVDGLFETRDDQPNRLKGWILNGGVAVEDRPIGLTISSESSSIRSATSIAKAINDRYTTIDRSGRRGVANPRSDRMVELLVPDDYRHNIGRYVQAVLSIAYEETPAERVNRLEQLDRQLGRPDEAREAALRLEAFGKEGVPALKRALRHPEPRVGFYAAEALAYLGESDGVEQLQMAAESDPELRWHALTALASLDDKSADDALAALLDSRSAETRYGAFRSLKTKSPNDPRVSGTRIGRGFTLHEIPAVSGAPMMHISRTKSAEIVLFGSDQKVNGDLLYVQKGLTVRSLDNGQVRISQFGTDGAKNEVCSNRVADVIRTMGKMGCDYGTCVRMFRDAMQKESLDSRLVVNAVPRIRSHTEEGEENALSALSDDEMANLPELFRPADTAEVRPRRVEKEMLSADGTPADREEEDEKPGAWKRVKQVFGRNGDAKPGDE